MGDHVLILEPLSAGAKLAAAARGLGAYVSALALDAGNVRLADECRSAVDTLITINVSDEVALVRTVERLHAERPITAVIPGFELFVPAAHRLAARLGLAANDPRHLDATRFKDVMMDRARDGGVPVPHGSRVTSVREATEVGADVGYPAVVKAPDDTASCDVYKVNNRSELLDRCERIWRREVDADWGHATEPAALVQEFVRGAEVSVETVSFGYGPVLMNVTDKLVTDGPQFVELGHSVPSALPNRTLDRVRDLTIGVHDTFGIRIGAAHLEFRLPPDREPVLIEVAARLAGGRILELVEMATGVDMCRETVRSFLGAGAPERPLTYRAGACVRFLTAPARGSFLIDADAARTLPGLRDLAVPDRVEASGALRDYRDRHGTLIASADTATEACRRADAAIRRIVFASAPEVPA